MAFENTKIYDNSPADSLLPSEVSWVQVGASGIVQLKETTTPSATTGYGKMYVKSSDHLLYYLDYSGTEIKVGGSSGAIANDNFTSNGTTTTFTSTHTVTQDVLVIANGQCLTGGGTDYTFNGTNQITLNSAIPNGLPIKWIYVY